jgi:hypothetical protein
MSSHLNRLKYGIVALLHVAFTLLFSVGLRADVTGSILGVVHDRSQAVITGASVVVTNVQTNFKSETTSAADGSYRFLALAAGHYKLAVKKPMPLRRNCETRRLREK